MRSPDARRVWLRAALALWWSTMTLGSHWPRLDIGSVVGYENDAFAIGLDKWLHISCYLGLAWLLLASRACWLVRRPNTGPKGNGKPFDGMLSRGEVVRTLLFVVAWAGGDELTQLLSPGRQVWWTDWAASCAGIGLGAMLWGFGAILTQPADSFVGYTRIVAGLTLVSRFFGLARDVVLAYAFGRTPIMDAFAIAFLIPNLFRRLFGEGALGAAFIPQYKRLANEDANEACKFGGLIVGRVALGLSLVPILGLVIAGGLILWGGLSDEGNLAAGLSIITLWYAPLVCATALLGAMLQSHGRFGPPAAAPVVLNIMIIASAVVAAYGLPHDVPESSRLYLVAAAVVGAGVLQVAWQWTAQRRATPGLRLHVRSDADPVSREATNRLLRQWLPTVLGLAIFQLNVFLDGLIAMFFSGPPGGELSLFGYSTAYPMEDGSVITLGMAQRLYEFPLGVFGIAIATAIYPSLAGAANNRAAFTGLLHRGMRLSMFIGLPASVGLLLVRDPLCEALYGPGGALKEGDAAAVAWVLMGYAPAIWAFSLNHMLTRSFYARQDAVTPVRIGMGLVGLNILLNLTLIWPLGAAGLAWSTSVCAMLQTGILLWFIRKHVEHPLDASVVRSWLRIGGGVLVMGVTVWWLLRSFDLDEMSRLGAIALLGGASALGAVVYIAAAMALGMRELRWLIGGREE